MWTPEALRNGNDSAWDIPFPAAEPGVYILEARNVSSGLSGPPCLLPDNANISMDLSASDTCAADASSSAGVPSAQDSSAAVGFISLVDSPERVFDGCSQFLINDSSSTAS